MKATTSASPRTWTVGEPLSHIAQVGRRKPVYAIYVLDPDDHQLIHVVSLRDLVVTDSTTRPIISSGGNYGSQATSLIIRALSASAPFVATIVDVSGLVIYFGVAYLILWGTLL